MTPTIAVVATVRGRWGLLYQMLASLRDTAADPASVEIVLRVDADDATLIKSLNGERLRFIVGPRLGYAGLSVGVNEAARLTTAPLVLVVNDDAVFDTPNWDTRLCERAAQYPDGIFVLGVNTTNAKNFIFPCVSARQIALLGGVFDPRTIYSDIWLRDVLQPVGRAIRVPEVTIRHDWQGRSPDQDAAMKTFQSPEHQALYRQCVEEGRAKVAAVLPVPA